MCDAEHTRWENWQLRALLTTMIQWHLARADAVLEIFVIKILMPRSDFMGRGWAMWSRRIDEELAKENLVLFLTEDSLIGIDRKTHLLAGGYKPEHAESYK